MSTAFLTEEDTVKLTGRCLKSKQIAALRKMGIAFFVNASGHPVVPVSAVEGRKEAPHKKKWEMPE